jgi:hypothetical protein
MPKSPSQPLPAPSSPMSPPLRVAYNRMIACIRASRRADERATVRASLLEQARAEYERVRAEQDQAA